MATDIGLRHTEMMRPTSKHVPVERSAVVGLPDECEAVFLNPKGYPVGIFGGRRMLVHRWVYRKHHGELLKGYEVHHINENKLDARPSNLVQLDPLTHRRLASDNYRLTDDAEWEKRCPDCPPETAWRPATGEHFYMNVEGWPQRRCKGCHKRQAAEYNRRRRRRKRDELERAKALVAQQQAMRLVVEGRMKLELSDDNRAIQQAA